MRHSEYQILSSCVVDTGNQHYAGEELLHLIAQEAIYSC